MTFYLLEGYQSNYAKIVSDRKYEIDNKVIIMDQFVVISNHMITPHIRVPDQAADECVILPVNLLNTTLPLT